MKHFAKRFDESIHTALGNLRMEEDGGQSTQTPDTASKLECVVSHFLCPVNPGGPQTAKKEVKS